MDNIDKSLRQLLSGNYGVSTGDILERILSMAIASELMNSEVLRRVIELEQRLTEGTANPDRVGHELKELSEKVAGQTNDQLKNIIADLHLKHDK